MNEDAEFLGEFDRTAVHNARAHAGEFKHFVVTNAFDATRFGNDARVGGIDAVDVGVNVAAIGLKRGGKRDGGRIASAAAERRDVEVVVDSLEPGGNDDFPFVERAFHAVGGDRADSRSAIGRVGADPDLGAGETDGFISERFKRDRHKRNRNLLARREEHVHLTGVRVFAKFMGKLDEVISLFPHRAHDHNDLIACAAFANRFPRRRQNLLSIRYARSAKFLYDQRHVVALFPPLSKPRRPRLNRLKLQRRRGETLSQNQTPARRARATCRWHKTIIRRILYSKGPFWLWGDPDF